MKVIPAQESDMDELTNIEIESKLRSIPYCIEDFEVDYISRFTRWQNYFKKESPNSSKPERIILKALINEKTIGYIAGHLTTRYGMDAEIQSFYILKEFQRQGIGTKLLINFIEWLISQKAISLCVGINTENKYQAFYLKYDGQHLNDHWFFWSDVHSLLKRMS